MDYEEFLMPEQYADLLRPSRMPPIKAFWYAVLRDALWCMQSTAKNGQMDRQRKADRAWVESYSREPGSFLFVCEVIGVDAQALRERILSGGPAIKLRKSPVMRGAKIRLPHRRVA
jgi:hypothetical protein